MCNPPPPPPRLRRASPSPVPAKLQHQQVISLLHLLGAVSSTTLRRLQTGGEHTTCAGRVRLAFVRNDYVCEPGWSAECHDASHKGHALGNTYIGRFARGTTKGGTQLASYDTIVMNAGLHVLPSKTVQQHATRLAHWLQTTHYRLLIWRTAVPGHVNCTAHIAPLAEAYTPPAAHEYRWDHLAVHDALRRSIFDTVLGGRMKYLDAAAVSNRRADRHLGLHIPRSPSRSQHVARGAGRADDVSRAPDCLHYCLPGPPDDWNRVLKAMLIQHTRS